jgi:hypothetical protein
MKKTAAFLLVMLFAVSAFAQGDVWFDGSFDQAMEAAKKGDKLIMIDFWADG